MRPARAAAASPSRRTELLNHVDSKREARVRIDLFTVEEANKLAIDIRPRLERLVERKREFDALEKRMGILLVATSGAAPENPDTRELRSLEEKRRRLGESI